jgi:hypothetical protein
MRLESPTISDTERTRSRLTEAPLSGAGTNGVSSLRGVSRPPPSRSGGSTLRANANRSLGEVTMLEVVPGQYRFGLWKNVILATWEGRADLPGVASLDKIGRDLRAAHPGQRYSNIHIVLEGVELPTRAAREGFIEIMKSQADSVAAVSVVIQGSGFLASALRSFITGMRLLSPSSFAFRLHGTTLEALRWLPAEHRRMTGEEIDVRQLDRVLYPFASRLK